MKKSVFNINKFNIIEDDEYYYVFRALNSGDESDLQNEIITDASRKIEKIRPDIDRYNESGKESIFTDSKEISLKEAWRHIRVHHTKDTNVISLTSNANIVIDYGNGADHNKRYIMVKVPKKDYEKSNIYNAGLFMLEELEKIIEVQLAKLPPDSEVLELVKRVNDAQNYKEVSRTISELFKKPKTLNNLKRKNAKKITSPLAGRFAKRDYFTEEQQTEFNKIMAKLSILENKGIIKSIMPVCEDNTSLIRTIGVAFSSAELLHYKEIPKEKFIEIQGKSVELISLLQQIEDTDDVKKLKTKIITYINKGYELIENNGKVCFGNSEENIEIPNINNEEFFSSRDFEPSSLSIEDCYKITNGNMGYEDAKILIEFYTRLCISRKKTLEYINVLKALGANEEIIKKIKEKSFIVDTKIVSRNNNLKKYNLSESIAIAINRNGHAVIPFSAQEQIIESIKKLTENQLNDIAKNSGTNLEQKLIEEQIYKTRERSENEYYLEAIIDGLDLNKIYKTERILTEKEREKIFAQNQNVDFKRLYKAFEKAGISTSDIPYYIICLVIENGYKNLTLEELSKQENLEEIIFQNIKNLNYKITPYFFDKLIGIRDNKRKVEGTSIELRDYQADTDENIDNIHKDRRFAGVVLPTGGGKSFVSMVQMIKHSKENIVYIAPRITILAQFKYHIIKNVLNIELVSETERAKNIPSKSGRERLTLEEAEERIKEVFPHLKMMCYQTLTSMSDEEIKGLNPDYIILDEAHRAGANTYYPKVKTLIEANKKSKILAITATPERDDLSDALEELGTDEGDKTALLDMMRNLALLTGEYTNRDIIEKKHLASELYLLDAIRMGYVVSPKVVSFDYTLKDSDEYKTVKNLFEEETNPERKKEYSKALAEMNEIIENSEKKGMAKIISENITRKNGKYIAFLPRNKTKNGTSAEEYMLKELDNVKDMFSEIDGEPESWFLLSNRKDGKINEEELSKFELSESEHIKLLAAIDMLNEGVHVSGIAGCIMLRKIDGSRKILYLQQIGRCIFAIDPDNPPSPEEIPVIFDVYNNYLAHDLNREINKGNTTSDLQRMLSAAKWIERHQYFPDINSEVLEEARKAIILKKIQKKYARYLENFDTSTLTESEIYEIEQILELGKREDINLWEKEIPERIIPPGEAEIDEVKIFEATATQKRFNEIFHNVTRKNKVKLGKSYLLKQTLIVLDVLSENGIIINNIKITETTKFKELYERLPEDEKEYLKEHGITDDFNIYESYKNAKEAFYYRIKTTDNIFAQYSVSQLKKCGIFEPLSEWDSKKKCTNDRNFITHGPKEFLKKNIVTGTYYDENNQLYEDTSEKYLLEQILLVLEVISKKGIEITNNAIKNLDFKDFFEQLDEKTRIELEAKRITEEFDLFKQYNFAKHRFYERHEDTDRVFNEYEFEDLKKYGMFESRYENSTYRPYNKYGFLIHCPVKFRNLNINTGTAKDEKGKTSVYYKKDDSKRCIEVLELLSEGGIEINNETICENTILANYIDKISETRKKKILKLVADDLEYNLYEEYNALKYKFKFYQWIEFEKTFKYLPFNTAIKIGLFEKFINPHTGEEVCAADKDGFVDIQCSYLWFKNKNIYTGTEYSPEGFDINGIDSEGFDKETRENNLGFYKTGIHSKTGAPVDEHGFNIEGYFCEKNEAGEWISTGSKYDKVLFNIYGISKVTNEKINEYNFDIDGYYYDDEQKTDKKENPDGFSVDKTHKDTGTFLNPDNFDIDGFFYKLNSDGTYEKTNLKYNADGWSLKGINEKTHTIYDEDGFDKSGYNEYGFNRQKIHRNSTKFDKYGFDFEGYFWEKNESGEYIETLKKVNSHGFNRDRIFQKHFRSGNYIYLRTDDYGFDIDGCYICENKTLYSDVYHYKEEKAKKIRTNPEGFDCNGYWYKKMPDGTLKNTGKKLNPAGFNIAHKAIIIDENGEKKWSKINKYGFDYRGYYYTINENGTFKRTNSRVDPYGFYVNGNHHITKHPIDTNYFDRDGYYWKKDYEKKQYVKTDKKLNPRNFNRDGIYCIIQEDGKIVPTGQTRDPEGYDVKGLDINGFNRKGIHCKTKKIVNEHGFNKDGFYCQETENGEYIITDQIYNQRGFKIDGTYLETGKKYDKYKFTIDGFNKITKQNVNLRGFDCNGIFVEKNSIYDNNGFKLDGTYLETGEKYNPEGYNCYGLDENGLNKDGEEAPEVMVIKAVIEKKVPTDFQRQALTILNIPAATYINVLKEKYSAFVADKNDIYRLVYNTAFEIEPEILEKAVRARTPNKDIPDTHIQTWAKNYENAISEIDDLLYL